MCIRDSLKAVDDVSFEIYKGETLGMVGESGCGKTTCGRTCIGLYSRTDGEVLFKGKDPQKVTGKEKQNYKKSVQMVFQDPYGSLDPRMTVAEIIGEGIDIHHLAKNKKERNERIYHYLELVGLNREHANRFVHEFSGGQRPVSYTHLIQPLYQPAFLNNIFRKIHLIRLKHLPQIS